MRGPRWVNQHAYDIQWQGKVQRVYIRRLQPLPPISDALLQDAAKHGAAQVQAVIRRLAASHDGQTKGISS